jgi:Bifunctional DNA primase/polymerase, N-terminal
VFAELAARAGQPVPVTFTVATPSGGRHLYFTAPTGHRLRNTAGRLGWRIDTRAHGGYVVSPGSSTPTGTYAITEDRPLTPLPAWLTQALAVRPPAAVSAPAQTAVARQDRYLRAALDQEITSVRNAPSGAHNKTLFDAALTLGRLVAGGALPEATVRAALLDAFGVHITNPACDCTQTQARRTISSGLGYSAQRPRHVPATHTTTHPPKGNAA